MDRSFWLKVALALFIVHGAYAAWRDRPAADVAGVVAPREPLQTAIEGATPVPRGRWSLVPRARYDLTVRVLGRERYALDRLAPLAPVDLAVGWGPMSDGRILAALEVSQGARFYSVRWPAVPPLPPSEIMSHSANMHLIPETRAAARTLLHLRVGEVVHLEGLLVDATRDDGAWIRTSLTRTDTGAGACEVMLVASADVVGPGGAR